MIAMQYSFTLPADYDMSIISRRIRDNAPKLDGFSDLRFKAFLSAWKGEMGSAENLYAPFYLWSRPEGMEAFLSGPGFKAVSAAFGWPSITSWIVWDNKVSGDLAETSFAVRRTVAIEPYRDLCDLRSAEIRSMQETAERGAVATVTGFNPRDWTLVEFSLWKDVPKTETGQIYQVGHVSV